MCFYNYTHSLVKIKPEFVNILTTPKTGTSSMDLLYQALLEWQGYFLADLDTTPDLKYHKAKVNKIIWFRHKNRHTEQRAHEYILVLEQRWHSIKQRKDNLFKNEYMNNLVSILNKVTWLLLTHQTQKSIPGRL